VTLLDADDGSEVHRLASPDMQPLSLGFPLAPGLAFNRDGSLLAYRGMSGRITVFEVAIRAIIQTLVPPPATASSAFFPRVESYVGPVAFSPDGTKLACGVPRNRDDLRLPFRPPDRPSRAG
jgi:hypothetical protein